jgi:hypothetical protein
VDRVRNLQPKVQLVSQVDKELKVLKVRRQ